MSPVRFGVQILIVLTLMVAVSWPELGRVRAVSVWRADGPLSASRAATSRKARRVSDRRSRDAGEFGFGSAAYAPSNGLDGSALRERLSENTVEGGRRRPIPAGVLALGAQFNAILGRARTALNSPMPGARLVLRNLESGIVEARATANDAGEFVFLDVMPSDYIVELVGDAGDVNATSDSLAVDVGDLVETTVRGTSQTALRTLFGSLLQGTADDAVSAAARDGVAQVTTPDRCVSPPCSR
jgi:hypothetical protein